MQTRFLALLQGAFATAAIAQPDSGGIDFSRFPWKAPGPNDLRGPCPGLNTLASSLIYSTAFANVEANRLANHGFISRDGRNLTPSGVLKAAQGKNAS
jgi:hypothetical protein